MKHFNLTLAAALCLCSASSAFALDDPIKIQPEGNAVEYCETADVYNLVNYSIEHYKDGGMVSRMVYADNDVVYLFNPVFSYGADYSDTRAWIKGKKEGNDLVFNLPQAVYVDVWEGTKSYVVASIMKRVETGTDEPDFAPVAEEENVLRLTADGDNFVWKGSEDGSLALGVCDTTGSWAWTAEYNLTWKPFNEDLTLLPANAEPETYQMLYSGTGKDIKVAFVGNDVYLSNLTEYAPNAWVKGSINGDKCTFEGSQYMGMYTEMLKYVYFTPCTISVTEDGVMLEPASELLFNYSENSKSLSSTGNFAINSNRDFIRYFEVMQQPVIRKKSAEVLSYVPNKPNIISFYEYDPIFVEESSLIFDLPTTSVENDLLNDGYLYYSVYVDDDPEPWMFDPSEYKEMSIAATTMIPYNYTDNWSFLVSGTWHKVYFMFHDAERIGVQNVYKKGDDIFRSEIAWHENSRVNNVATEAVSETYYDLNGRRVVNPEHGIYLVRAINNDGTVTTSKVVK